MCFYYPHARSHKKKEKGEKKRKEKKRSTEKKKLTRLDPLLKSFQKNLHWFQSAGLSLPFWSFWSQTKRCHFLNHYVLLQLSLFLEDDTDARAKPINPRFKVHRTSITSIFSELVLRLLLSCLKRTFCSYFSPYLSGLYLQNENLFILMVSGYIGGFVLSGITVVSVEYKQNVELRFGLGHVLDLGWWIFWLLAHLDDTHETETPVILCPVTCLLEKMVKPCWKSHDDDDLNGRVDGLLWSKDLGHHVYGQFSMAVIQANNVVEDQSQLESGALSMSNPGPQGTFIGVYDGHGGTEASRFVNDNLFSNLKSWFSSSFQILYKLISFGFLVLELCRNLSSRELIVMCLCGSLKCRICIFAPEHIGKRYQEGFCSNRRGISLSRPETVA